MSKPEPRAQRAKVGQVLRGKWRLDALLGVGGMACVYSATHRNGKRGAVKVLHVEHSLDADTRSRFLREGYVANKVDHPGAVSVLDDDVDDDGSVFLVMELLEGETVDARLRSRPDRPMASAEVLAVVAPLLDVLAAAHDKGIVHRDIKPENLFITRSGALKVLDFGIARLREAASTRTQATQSGSLLGTPSFMPPEQALGNWDEIDGRTDVWAVGATMFRLLTGRPVHQADSVHKILLAAMTTPAPPIRSVLPTVPPAMADVVDRALAFDRGDRWPDARSMQQALRSAFAVGERDRDGSGDGKGNAQEHVDANVPRKTGSGSSLVGSAAAAPAVVAGGEERTQVLEPTPVLAAGRQAPVAAPSAALEVAAAPVDAGVGHLTASAVSRDRTLGGSPGRPRPVLLAVVIGVMLGVIGITTTVVLVDRGSRSAAVQAAAVSAPAIAPGEPATTGGEPAPAVAVTATSEPVQAPSAVASGAAPAPSGAASTALAASAPKAAGKAPAASKPGRGSGAFDTRKW